MSDSRGLREIVSELNDAPLDEKIASEISRILETWQKEPGSFEPIREFQEVLQQIRLLPPGMKRIHLMNSFVRVLGQPQNLSTFFRMLVAISKLAGSTGEAFCNTTLKPGTMHSMYGWCGQFLLLESFGGSTPGTFLAEEGLEKLLGITPPEWGLSVHVWQPNEKAAPFHIDKSPEPTLAIEPPHSHPFDFVSYVVKGEIHQSIYQQVETQPGSVLSSKSTRYPKTNFQHVDGVWPPHSFQRSTKLEQSQDRVRLVAGDSYFMQHNWIHDFDVNKESAKSTPTVTLFLCSECIVKPHVYIAEEMADFHKANPDLRRSGARLSDEAWEQCMEMLAGYVSGENEELALSKFIKHPHSYAFMHTHSVEETRVDSA